MKIQVKQFDPETGEETFCSLTETCQTPMQVAMGAVCNLHGAASFIDGSLGDEAWTLDRKNRVLAHYRRVG